MTLQPYLISEFKTGLSTYLQPWARPVDAFQPLTNAYIYRGMINKRNGFIQFGNQLGDTNPVMGLLQRINESNGQVSLVAVSTQNAYLYDAGSGDFDQLTEIGGANSVFWMGTATGSGNILPTFWPNLALSSVSITDGTTIITDDGSGNLSSGGIFASGGTIDYTTGVATLNFTGTTDNVSLSISATTSGNYFTGTISNFFNYTNWQPTDPVTLAPSVSYLYMTNNVDPITLFDGTYLSRPIFYIESSFTDYIVTCLDVQVYQNRLLSILPTVNISGTNYTLNQSIYFSARFNPFNFINDVFGNGGQVTAATGDIIQCEELIRDAIVVFFSNSTWLFRFTGILDQPFIWQKLNSSKSTNSPYASVDYDERATSVGGTGLIACDAVNVNRYDIPIIDYYETTISEQYYAQAFSQRYDNLNQAWMLYVSNDRDPVVFPVVGGVAPGSDSALIYNYLENSWATYEFSVPLTCLGKFYSQTGLIWSNATFSWESADSTWSSYSQQKLAPILLAGDTSGNIYWMDYSLADNDNGTDFDVSITTTRWNPVVSAGQKTQFCYIDFYYSIVSTNPSSPVQLTLSFFVDNSTSPALTNIITLDGPVNSSYTWKRIYTNLVGEFIQMNIDPVDNNAFQILGFILWARPAGRFTP